MSIDSGAAMRSLILGQANSSALFEVNLEAKTYVRFRKTLDPLESSNFRNGECLNAANGCRKAIFGTFI
jgi:hypothetical protein